MKNQTEQYTKKLTLTATQLSILRSGLEALIKEQKLHANTRKGDLCFSGPDDYLQKVQKLEKQLNALNIEMEDQVLADIKELQKQPIHNPPR